MVVTPNVGGLSKQPPAPSKPKLLNKNCHRPKQNVQEVETNKTIKKHH